jgi:hypothetical protein
MTMATVIEDTAEETPVFSNEDLLQGALPAPGPAPKPEAFPTMGTPSDTEEEDENLAAPDPEFLPETPLAQTNLGLELNCSPAPNFLLESERCVSQLSKKKTEEQLKLALG